MERKDSGSRTLTNTGMEGTMNTQSPYAENMKSQTLFETIIQSGKVPVLASLFDIFTGKGTQRKLFSVDDTKAKIYAENGKTEKAYEVLNDINQEKNPIFGLLYTKFKDIDLGTEEQKYLFALDRLKTITPSNYSVISEYMQYYEKKGIQKQKENFNNEIKKT